MKNAQPWEEAITNELKKAQQARAVGNEGKAGVCARRAAGAAIAEYVTRQNLPNAGSSAYDRLQFIASHSGSAPRAREISQHLILRVNEEFKLPIDADIISETQELVQILLGISLSVDDGE